MEKLRLMPCWKFQSSSTSWKERRRRKCYTGGVRLSPVIFIEKQRTPVVSHVSLSRHHNHAAITGGTTNERSHPGYTTSLEDTNKAICQRNTNKAICQRKIMDKFIASALLHPQPQLLLLPTVMANSRSYGVGNSSVEAAERRLSAQRERQKTAVSGGGRWQVRDLRWRWREKMGSCDDEEDAVVEIRSCCGGGSADDGREVSKVVSCQSNRRKIAQNLKASSGFETQKKTTQKQLILPCSSTVREKSNAAQFVGRNHSSPSNFHTAGSPCCRRCVVSKIPWWFCWALNGGTENT
nr:hypothetical protein Iba_chr01aCG14920 [Ipomoea batatas]GMC54141.1 hypothetical protein Iba_chr01dCG13340 [Ipomoea batatas]